MDCAPFEVRGLQRRVVKQMAWVAEWALTATAPLPCQARNPFHSLGPGVVKVHFSICAHVLEWMFPSCVSCNPDYVYMILYKFKQKGTQPLT